MSPREYDEIEFLEVFRRENLLGHFLSALLSEINLAKFNVLRNKPRPFLNCFTYKLIFPHVSGSWWNLSWKIILDVMEPWRQYCDLTSESNTAWHDTHLDSFIWMVPLNYRKCVIECFIFLQGVPQLKVLHPKRGVVNQRVEINATMKTVNLVSFFIVKFATRFKLNCLLHCCKEVFYCRIK